MSVVPSDIGHEYPKLSAPIEVGAIKVRLASALEQNCKKIVLSFVFFSLTCHIFCRLEIM